MIFKMKILNLLATVFCCAICLVGAIDDELTNFKVAELFVVVSSNRSFTLNCSSNFGSFEFYDDNGDNLTLYIANADQSNFLKISNSFNHNFTSSIILKNSTYVHIECLQNTPEQFPTINDVFTEEKSDDFTVIETENVTEDDNDDGDDDSTSTIIPIVHIDEEMTNKLSILQRDSSTESDLKNYLDRIIRQYLFEKRRITKIRKQIKNELEQLDEYENENEVKFKSLIESQKIILEQFQAYMLKTYGNLYTTTN